MKSPTVRGITRIVRQVLDERDRQVKADMIQFRVLTINFEERWFGWDGKRVHVSPDGPQTVKIPVLETSKPVVPFAPWEFYK